MESYYVIYLEIFKKWTLGPGMGGEGQLGEKVQVVPGSIFALDEDFNTFSDNV